MLHALARVVPERFERGRTRSNLDREGVGRGGLQRVQNLPAKRGLWNVRF